MTWHIKTEKAVEILEAYYFLKVSMPTQLTITRAQVLVRQVETKNDTVSTASVNRLLRNKPLSAKDLRK